MLVGRFDVCPFNFYLIFTLSLLTNFSSLLKMSEIVFVYLFMLHCGVPTRIVKPDIFDIVGTSLQSHTRGKKYIKNSK